MKGNDLRISKVQAFQTSDGEFHSSLAMAHQYIANQKLCDLLSNLQLDSAQDIANCLSSNLNLVREWLDACDALERESLMIPERKRTMRDDD